MKQDNVFLTQDQLHTLVGGGSGIKVTLVGYREDSVKADNKL